MIVSTTENIGRDYEICGFVMGTTVNSKHIGKDIGAGFKTIVGGEIKGYTEMIVEAQDISKQRMIQEAMRLSADAIVGVRLGTSSVMQSAAEVTFYGTAVKFI